MIEVNGHVAKSSKEVKTGDRIAIKRRSRVTEIEVASIPTSKQVAKSTAGDLYRILRDEAIATDPLA